MEAKAYGLAVIFLVAGLIGGYFVGSMAFQSQLVQKEAEIAELRRLLTQIKIDVIDWEVHNNKLTATIGNIGVISASAESISVRLNAEGSGFVTEQLIPTVTLVTRETERIVWDEAELELQYETSYVIRVTCSTGFYYEMVASSPQAETQIRIGLVEWNVARGNVTVTVRNTGEKTATIYSISIRENTPGAQVYTKTYAEGNTVDVGGTIDLAWTHAGLTPSNNTSYVIRATCSTGFYYEMVKALPGKIRTVLGDISSDELGLALSHEHVMADFIGADKVSKERYDLDEVFNVMLPYLEEIRQLGVTGFVDCTPAYMARDVELLARLSEASGIHIIAPTGLYMEPYLPEYAFELSVDQLAEMWTREIYEGIDGTPIKAGFIKIAVNPGSIIPIQEKIVRAAARCSLSTGAVIACHTVSGVAAMDLMRILEEEGMDLGRLVVVHCDAEQDLDYHIEILRRGAWVEYDAVKEDNAERTLNLIDFVLENGYEDQLLLSQDAGYYHVGEERGGNIRGYAYLVGDFVSLMKERGLSQELIDKILIENPARAFQIGSTETEP